MNKFRHKSRSTNANSLALRIIHFSESFLRANQGSPSNPIVFPILNSQRIWKPSLLGILKANIDLAFLNVKIGNGILVRNHFEYSSFTSSGPF